ncbi:hypothetical protein BJF79_34130 [Actinomadura sp. CNU-125]|nr:hypothetical protein BJF79_34130 [Actinomadura sp. CNU-125]
MKGLEVLAEIATPQALTALDRIQRTTKFDGVKKEAAEMLGRVAAARGLSAEQLADRIVPTLGLDGDGSATLDYGPRRFTVRFDARLRPVVADEGGGVRTTLPKPGAKDDPALAAAARERFAGLKKDVRAVAAEQADRLEQAMRTRRRWTVEDFHRFVLDHPIVGRLAHGLVWVARQDDAATSFRIAEDGTFADVRDDTRTIADTARVGVAHAVEFGDDRAAWAEMLADYEVLQPFPQLGRRICVLTAQERRSGRLTRFQGFHVTERDRYRLSARGWEARGDAWARTPPSGHRVKVHAQWINGDDILGEVRLVGARPGDAPVFGNLDPVLVSEILAVLVPAA